MVEGVSGIRLIGMATGSAGLLFAFFYYRGVRWKKSSFVIFTLFSLLMLSISISPDLVNFPRDLLAMEGIERGRIFTLLIFSVFILFVLVFYLKSKLDFFQHQFDLLIRGIGKKSVSCPEIDNHLKPITILIPALNESENLSKLIPKLPKKIGEREIGLIVVDDGSRDDTRKTVEGFGCMCVDNVIHRGGGAALRLGYDILLEHGVEICITMDADNQHNPEDIPKLLEPLLSGEADIVIGSRVLGNNLNINRIRAMGLKVFNSLMNLMLNTKITDCSNGFRAFRLDVLQTLQLKEVQYHTSELIFEAVKKGYRLKEAPITVSPRTHGGTKKGRSLHYGLNFAKVIFKSWFR